MDEKQIAKELIKISKDVVANPLFSSLADDLRNAVFNIDQAIGHLKNAEWSFGGKDRSVEQQIRVLDKSAGIIEKVIKKISLD